MHIILTKGPMGFLPGDPETEEFATKIKIGESIHSDFRRMRNIGFHRKLFSLFHLAFDNWHPAEITTKYGVPAKNFERFRKDCTILAGYYHLVHRLDETFRVEADSLSFGKMDQDTFDKLYQRILDVLMEKISMFQAIGEEEVRALCDKFLAYA